MNRITIGNKRVLASDRCSVRVEDGNVIIQNDTIIPLEGATTIVIHGNTGNIKSNGNVTVIGSVTGNVDAAGDVWCANVEGDVEADGDVRCYNVGGKVVASRDVAYQRSPTS